MMLRTLQECSALRLLCEFRPEHLPVGGVGMAKGKILQLYDLMRFT
ncbi:hypothetical protein SAMN05444166_2352 [Singulisphaera sp. GP187]|nr:hypothetical protein SAMN05444166_2352 [Singulisphaera sp. GP187]